MEMASASGRGDVEWIDRLRRDAADPERWSRDSLDEHDAHDALFETLGPDADTSSPYALAAPSSVSLARLEPASPAARTRGTPSHAVAHPLGRARHILILLATSYHRLLFR